MSGTTKGLQLRSLIKKSGELELSLAEVPIPEPGPDQVLAQVASLTGTGGLLRDPRPGHGLVHAGRV